MKLSKSLSFIIMVPLLVLISCAGSDSGLSDRHKHLVENYEFTDWNGNSVKVSDFKGSIVVVDFWETWCGPCLSAFPGFQQALDEFPEDLVIIAATAGWQNGREDAVKFKDENSYDFIYVDGSELASVLGFRGIPYKIIIDRDGEIERVQRGSGGADREYEKLAERINNYAD